MYVWQERSGRRWNKGNHNPIVDYATQNAPGNNARNAPGKNAMLGSRFVANGRVSMETGTKIYRQITLLKHTNYLYKVNQ